MMDFQGIMMKCRIKKFISALGGDEPALEKFFWIFTFGKQKIFFVFIAPYL